VVLSNSMIKSWFLQTENKLQPSQNFQNTFPVLTELLQQAKILNFEHKQSITQTFRGLTSDLSCSWLNKKIEKKSLTPHCTW
jgi:phosphoglycerol transferase MdoB-like AlkP superfamily enzyme